MDKLFSPLQGTLSTVKQQKHKVIAHRAQLIRQLLQMSGIAPNGVTLAALLLVAMEAAQMSKVTIADVIATLEEIDRVGQSEDADEPDEQLITWPVN